MNRYCLVACVGILAVGLSCDHVKQQFKTDARNESVTSDTQPDGEIGSGELPGSGANDDGGQPRRSVGEPAKHVVFKPVASSVPEITPKSEPPPLEIQAMELAAKELAINLRFMEEEDAAKRAELEREMVKLRQQRQSLYQPRVEGK